MSPQEMWILQFSHLPSGFRNSRMAESQAQGGLEILSLGHPPEGLREQWRGAGADRRIKGEVSRWIGCAECLETGEALPDPANCQKTELRLMEQIYIRAKRPRARCPAERDPYLPEVAKPTQRS